MAAQQPRVIPKLSHNLRQRLNSSKEASEISAFIGPSSKVRISRAADLDGDGDLDLVAVIAKNDVAPSDVPRTLLLLKRAADGRLERAVENANAVLAEDRGGTMSDPLQDLTARRGGFTLNFEGGSRELWSHQYSFEYVSGRGTWLLTEFRENVLDRHEGKNEQRTLRPSDFGEVTAADFDPDALAAD